MKFKKTRIVFSVFFGILSLLLVGLWVRSYWKRDRLQLPLPDSRHLNVWSQQGQITLLNGDHRGEPSLDTTNIPVGWHPTGVSRWWGYDGNSRSTLVFFPHSLIIVVFTVLAATLWPWRFPRQFGLRTLLIIMTALAIGLWFIVWMAGR